MHVEDDLARVYRRGDHMEVGQFGHHDGQHIGLRGEDHHIIVALGGLVEVDGEADFTVKRAKDRQQRFALADHAPGAQVYVNIIAIPVINHLLRAEVTQDDGDEIGHVAAGILAITGLAQQRFEVAAIAGDEDIAQRVQRAGGQISRVAARQFGQRRVWDEMHQIIAQAGAVNLVEHDRFRVGQFGQIRLRGLRLRQRHGQHEAEKDEQHQSMFQHERLSSLRPARNNVSRWQSPAPMQSPPRHSACGCRRRRASSSHRASRPATALRR